MNATDYKYACYWDEFQVNVSRLKGEDTAQLHVRFFPLIIYFHLDFELFPSAVYIFNIYVISQLVTITTGTVPRYCSDFYIEVKHATFSTSVVWLKLTTIQLYALYSL